MRPRLIASWAAALLVAAMPSRAAAQSSATGGSLEVAAGPVWVGRATLGSGAARETTATGSAFTLFSSTTTVSSMAGFEARVGYALLRRLEVQGSASYVTPDLRVAVSNDAENAGEVTASERLHQYAFGGGVLWYLSIGRRFAPFLEAEGAYMRLLHDDRTLVETGRIYAAGAGVKYAFHAGSGGVKAIGLRVDARAVARSKAVLFDELRVSPAAGASIYFRF